MESVEFTGCDLAGCLFDDCDLRLASFGPGTTEAVTCAATTCRH
jgi:hypothetical protein